MKVKKNYLVLLGLVVLLLFGGCGDNEKKAENEKITTSTEERSGEDFKSDEDTTRSEDENATTPNVDETSNKNLETSGEETITQINAEVTTQKKSENTNSQTTPWQPATTSATAYVPQPTTTSAIQPTTTKAAAEDETVNSGTYTSDAGNIGMTHPIISTAGCTEDAAATKIVTELITSNMSQEQKVRALHDYLIRHTTYDESALSRETYATEPIHNAVGALVNRLAVCDGYAKAFKLLCNKAGIQCEVVLGEASDGAGNIIGHAWNVVMVDGLWYQIDVTFDDPLISNKTAAEYEAGDNLSYDYYLITDAIIYVDHTPDSPNTVNKCTSTKYVNTENMVYSQADVETVLYNLVKTKGIATEYSVVLHCTKGQVDTIINTYLDNALRNVIQKCVNEFQKGASSTSLSIKSGGNGAYDSLTLKLTVTWN